MTKFSFGLFYMHSFFLTFCFVSVFFYLLCPFRTMIPELRSALRKIPYPQPLVCQFSDCPQEAAADPMFKSPHCFTELRISKRNWPYLVFFF